MRRTTVWVTLGAMAAAGCAALGLTSPRCPAEGGPTWRELDSTHFALFTDLDSGDGRTVLDKLERARAAMLRLAWNTAAGPNDRTVAISLASRREYSDYFSDTFGYSGYDDFDKLFVTYGVMTPASQEALLHELAHTLANSFLPRQPRWLAEGLASYLETVHADAVEETVVMGDLGSRYARMNGHGRLRRVTAKELFDWRVDPAEPREIGAYYASSWLLVHYLIDTRASQFADLQTSMRHGQSFRVAWDHAFANVPLETLDAELDAYVAGGQFHRVHAPIPAVEVQPTERALTDAEVHALRARLRLLPQRSSLFGSQEARQHPERVAALVHALSLLSMLMGS